MNKAMVIGNLGNDPEVRYTQNETPVATFSVASTERWKDSDGNKQEHTEQKRSRLVPIKTQKLLPENQLQMQHSKLLMVPDYVCRSL